MDRVSLYSIIKYSDRKAAAHPAMKTGRDGFSLQFAGIHSSERR